MTNLGVVIAKMSEVELPPCKSEEHITVPFPSKAIALSVPVQLLNVLYWNVLLLIVYHISADVLTVWAFLISDVELEVSISEVHIIVPFCSKEEALFVLEQLLTNLYWNVLFSIVYQTSDDVLTVWAFLISEVVFTVCAFLMSDVVLYLLKIVILNIGVNSKFSIHNDK